MQLRCYWSPFCALTSELDNMDTLPSDLLPEILWNTDVAKVFHIKRGAEVSGNELLAKECDLRLCVKTYLGRSFKDPVKLLDAMSRSSVVLSGSNAANFFVPGSSTSGSDWDFYGGRNSRELSAFIEGSKGASIEWLEPIDKLQMMLSKGSGTIVVAPYVWQNMEEKDAFKDMVNDGLTVTSSELDPQERVVLEVVGAKAMLAREFLERDEYPDIQHVIYGRVKHESTVSEVQLMVSTCRENLRCEFLFSFHLSCVQSYISGHTAAHLYGHSACAMKTYRWEDNHIVGKGQESVNKYTRRGYTTIDVPLQGRWYNLRASNDNKAIILPSYNYTDTPQNLVRDYEVFSETITWVERKESTKQFTVLGLGSHRSHARYERVHSKNVALQNAVLKNWGVRIPALELSDPLPPVAGEN